LILTVTADKKLRLYLDTTIPNYVFTLELPEKMELTKKLFEKINQGEYEAYISDVVIEELKQAKEPKRSKLLSRIKDIIRLPFTPEARDLAEKYIKNKIISKNYLGDARHVAIATVYNIDAVVSWNYEHLVNINKIRMINIVNEITGYKHIEIISPEEV
jgi:predicted nucleic acid-binding protein